MKVIDLVKFSREMLKTLSENEVKTGDWKYVKMYEEYRHMRETGLKYRYVIAHLAMAYCISKSKIERIVHKFERTVK
jgi:hypothetical protein